MGLPCGPVVRDLPCNTGDLGLILGQGANIPHAAEQLTHTHNTYITNMKRSSGNIK